MSLHTTKCVGEEKKLNINQLVVLFLTVGGGVKSVKFSIP